MLTQLTKEQEQLMLDVRDEWLAKMFQYKTKLDRAKAKASIEWLYTEAKLKKPQLIIFVDSPLGMQYAANMLKHGPTGGQVWGQVWDQVWGQVRDQVGDQVWDQVGGQVRDQVGGQVRDQVRDQVWGQVRDQVGDQVWDQVWGQVRDQVWGQVRDQVGGQVRDQVGGQVRDQVRDQKLEWFDFAYDGVRDYGWCAFYDFFKRIGIVNHDGFEKYLELLDSGIYDMIQLENVCIACSLPTHIERTEVRGTMRLHSTEGFAVEFADGYGQNYLYGVYFTPELYKKVTSKRVSAKTVLSIENIDQRMAALKLLGPEKLLESSKAELIDRSERGNMLYKICGVFSQDAYYLKYVCPSTGRVYVSGIDPNIGKRGDPDLCMAWKFGLTLPQYQSLSVEA